MKESTIPKPAEQVIPQVSNLFKASLFVSLFFGSFYTPEISANQLDTYFSTSPNPAYIFLKCSAIILLAIFNCMLLTGIGVVAHKGIHGMFVKNRFWNEILGGLLSSLVITLPFYANRQFHLTHHRYREHPGFVNIPKSA